MSVLSHVCAAFLGWIIINHLIGSACAIYSFAHTKQTFSLRIMLWTVLTWPWQYYKDAKQ